MKKQSSLRQTLGLTQQEMATLLNVSRAQWGMYECGKRNLPTHAISLLAEIVSHMKLQDANQATNRQKETTDNQRQIIEHLLRENEYERALIEKKRKAIEKQNRKDAARKRLSDFVSQHRISKKSLPYPLVAPKVTARPLLESTETQLLRYEIKMESLALEHQLLQSKLT